ncbi:MAG: tRNA (adenosine(37)-N6)-dimethylallyltransferase MiaA [Lachnospiraceae bacterium]
MKKPLIILTGPTAVGKSAASIGIAKRIGGEIISADSIQVYKYMDIGSAKISREEMDGVNHYLIDDLDPAEEFNVARFQQMAKAALDRIYTAGHIPIVVGGTGFYIRALLYDTNFLDAGEETGYRRELEVAAREEGPMALHERLQKVDEPSAEMIHPNNVKRVIRALEFYHQTGTRISDHNQSERQKESPYNFAYFVLNEDRTKLYQRIDARVDKMLELGLVEEVQKLKNVGYDSKLVSMQGLGYKEIFQYLNGDCTLDEAIYMIKRDSRHFAKRQITWFKREPTVIWIEKEDFDYDHQRMENYMLDIIAERTII